jgi:hypothetical protein
MTLKDLGNIYTSDRPFTTKAALLQSIYRHERNEACGEAANKKTYGHLVSGGIETNKNFYYDETFEYAKRRVKCKKTEETIKKDRLFNNLLSSMPMAFNLFHPLMMLLKSDQVAADKIVAALFPEHRIKEVLIIDIEFIPTPIEDYIGDKSAMDAVIEYINEDGAKGIFGIECKYIDTLGANTSKENPLKRDTAEKSGLFTETGMEHVKKECTQIYRNFLLTEKYRMVKGYEYSQSVILAPIGHPTTEKEINSLKEFLIPAVADEKIRKYHLEDFAAIIAIHADESRKPWIHWFQKRYLAFDRVEELYKELKLAQA